ncbi:MAG: C4-dicarboxylate ABC transporter substrate-binding protein, partial [Oxalicibacterium faecigallinarum]|nr:C4-dicarboxylate ABC transporter substrate-binding protein [Oxalicibacterium faecigallinarum]
AQLEERVNQITIPLSFADELYRLRSNINLVRKRILWLSENAPESDRMSGAV